MVMFSARNAWGTWLDPYYPQEAAQTSPPPTRAKVKNESVPLAPTVIIECSAANLSEIKNDYSVSAGYMGCSSEGKKSEGDYRKRVGRERRGPLALPLLGSDCKYLKFWGIFHYLPFYSIRVRISPPPHGRLGPAGLGIFSPPTESSN